MRHVALLGLILSVTLLTECANYENIPQTPASVSCDMQYSLSELYFDKNQVITIEVKVWVVNTPNGKANTVSSQQITRAISKLNEMYNPWNFQFSLNTVESLIDFIYAGNMEYYRSIALAYQDPEYLNLFIFSNEQTFAPHGGALAIPSISVALKKQFLTTSVIAHEVGHAYGLHHTHKPDVTDGYTIESGDYVCDTPKSDPINGEVSGKCKYVGEQDLTEAEEDILVCNVMSYSFLECRSCLTPGQANRMRFIIEQSQDLRRTTKAHDLSLIQ